MTKVASEIIPVIMAGGNGSRLWPLSRTLRPKQFLKLTSDRSMLQETVNRTVNLTNAASLLICNEEHRFIAAEDMRELNKECQMILEPVGKNTAPAIALAAFHICETNPDSVMLVLAADHVIERQKDFEASVQEGYKSAMNDQMVTFGIKALSAETGYGYIKRGKSLEHGFSIEKFEEKPSLLKAQEYIDSGEYFWNSGMFMFKASRYLEELKLFRPDIYESCLNCMKDKRVDNDFIRIQNKHFISCASESIDYAVMEKTTKGVVVPMDAGWNDVGSWSALWDVSKKTEDNNVCKGDVITQDCENSYINSEKKLIAAVGVKDLVIIETKDAVLVANKKNDQDVKKIVQMLKDQGRSEHYLHREVYRPWGKYDSIDHGERDQVKRITVKPGEKLSIQMHHHRSEHWIVVSGTAKVTNGDRTILVTENQSTYIPLGTVHALENPGKIPLEMIEVQTGSYLGEDDIVRYEDRYGRQL
ncbi:mannose-1-phosphate guanylyltransferase/mannose-6-phosphate isomerase [Pelagibaculum spongiae]|nr:mannose-1-phosphate guanylyltransferase/mannose-6-phosphate isomerase [Pelagibaculum spongiae]